MNTQSIAYTGKVELYRFMRQRYMKMAREAAKFCDVVDFVMGAKRANRQLLRVKRMSGLEA